MRLGLSGNRGKTKVPSADVEISMIKIYRSVNFNE